MQETKEASLLITTKICCSSSCFDEKGSKFEGMHGSNYSFVVPFVEWMATSRMVN